MVAALAFPLPANIVFSLMGVPEQDYAQLKRWCGYRAAPSFGRLAADDQVARSSPFTPTIRSAGPQVLMVRTN